MVGERVYIVNVNNGERFDTYVIKGKRKSGEICLNGPAIEKCKKRCNHHYFLCANVCRGSTKLPTEKLFSQTKNQSSYLIAILWKIKKSSSLKTVSTILVSIAFAALFYVVRIKKD